MYKQLIEGVPFLGMNINPINLSASQKLEKYGYSLILNEFGCQKITKIEICIYDVLKEKSLPNILIVCPSQELYNWYRILITDIGIDFKIVASHKDALYFFSENVSNLYIMTPQTFKELDRQRKFRNDDGSSVVWDFIVIDEEISIDGINFDLYKNLSAKTEKLALISGVPVAKGDDIENMNSLVKSFLVNENAYSLTENDFYTNMISYGNASPVMRYFSENVYNGNTARNTEIINYTMDDKAVMSARRILDLKTGLPLYMYGGNVFEEYDLDERKVYFKPSFTSTDLEILRKADKKLDAFIDYIEKIRNDSNSRAVVYCIDDSTIVYLKKVLDVLFPSDVNAVRIAKGSVYSTMDVNRKFLVDDKTIYPKVIISTDALGVVGDRLDKVTHIFNYELPLNPAILEQRMLRHGDGDDKSFIIFNDTNGLFDSRILMKCIASRFPKSIMKYVPSRSVLLDLERFPEIIATAVADLFYINSYALEVDNCFDLIKRFRADYGIVESVRISKASELADISSKLLKGIFNLYSFNFDDMKQLEKNQIAELFETKFAESKNSLIHLDKDGKLVSIKDENLKNCLFNESYQNASAMQKSSVKFGDELAVKKLLIEHFSAGKFSKEIRDIISQLEYDIRFSVLHGFWRYMVKQKLSDADFSVFIKNFNEGGA